MHCQGFDLRAVVCLAKSSAQNLAKFFLRHKRYAWRIIYYPRHYKMLLIIEIFGTFLHGTLMAQGKVSHVSIFHHFTSTADFGRGCETKSCLWRNLIQKDSTVSLPHSTNPFTPPHNRALICTPLLCFVIGNFAFFTAQSQAFLLRVAGNLLVVACGDNLSNDWAMILRHWFQNNALYPASRGERCKHTCHFGHIRNTEMCKKVVPKLLEFSALICLALA